MQFYEQTYSAITAFLWTLLCTFLLRISRKHDPLLWVLLWCSQMIWYEGCFFLSPVKEGRPDLLYKAIVVGTIWKPWSTTAMKCFSLQCWRPRDIKTPFQCLYCLCKLAPALILFIEKAEKNAQAKSSSSYTEFKSKCWESSLFQPLLTCHNPLIAVVGTAQ